MKYLVKKSVLLLLVVLAFCACDNSNDNGEGIQPNPQPSKSVVNYTGEVEFVVDAPQIQEYRNKPARLSQFGTDGTTCKVFGRASKTACPSFVSI